MLLDRIDVPAEATGQFFHRHVENFQRGDDFDAVRHFHQRKHRTVVVMQMGQEDRGYLIFRNAAREQMLVEKRDRVD